MTNHQNRSTDFVSSPAAVRTQPGQPEYATGKGCLTLSIILFVLLVITIVAIIMFGNHAQ